MPTALTLHVITAKDVTPPPPSLQLQGDDIVNWITRASDGQISFNVVQHPSSQVESDGMDAATLQLMFQEFVLSSSWESLIFGPPWVGPPAVVTARRTTS